MSLTNFITGFSESSIQPQRISTQASIKEASTTNSSTTSKTPRVSDHSSAGNEYWTGNELNSLRSCIEFQFRMYYLKMRSAILTCIERKFVGFFDRLYNRHALDTIAEAKQTGINKESSYDGKFNIASISDISCLFKHGQWILDR